MEETTEPSSECRFPCSYCSETFAHRIRRILHIKINHLNDQLLETGSKLSTLKSSDADCSNDANESSTVISSMDFEDEPQLITNKVIDVESGDQGNKILYPACNQRFAAFSASSRRNKEEHGRQLESSNVERIIYNPIRVARPAPVATVPLTDHSYSMSPSAELEQLSEQFDDSEPPQSKRSRVQESEKPELESRTRFFSTDDTYDPSDGESSKCNFKPVICKWHTALESHLQTAYEVPAMTEAIKKLGAAQLGEPDSEGEADVIILSVRRKKRIMSPVPALISLDPDSAVSNKEVPSSGMESDSLVNSAIHTDPKPESMNTATTIDDKISRSLTRTSRGYKCFECKRFFNCRIKLLRHYSTEHPSVSKRMEQNNADVEDSTSISTVASDNENLRRENVPIRVSQHAARDTQNAVSTEEGSISGIEVGSDSLIKACIPTNVVTPDRRNSRNIIEPEVPINLHNRNKKRKLDVRNRKYKRDGCQQSFERISHRRNHTGGEPHKCPRCPRTFTMRDYLLRHQGVHYHVTQVGRNCHCPVRTCCYYSYDKRLMFGHLVTRHNIPIQNLDKFLHMRQDSASLANSFTKRRQPKCPKKVASTRWRKALPTTNETENSIRPNHREGNDFYEHETEAEGSSSECGLSNPEIDISFGSETLEAKASEYTKSNDEESGNSTGATSAVKTPSARATSMPKLTLYV